VVASRLAGFTLVETVIALVLSSIVLILVSTTFLVQSQFYSSQISYAGAHDNARVATERVASELRSVMDSGIVVAGRRTLTVRSPIALVGVCNRQGSNIHVHIDGGAQALDSAEVAGVAWLDQATGVWSYRNTTWNYISNPGGGSASRCAANGADTLGATGDFRRLRRFNLLYGSFPNAGDVLLLFRQTTFKIQDSQLDPGRLALFRQTYGGTFIEFASGMDTTAQFRYRTGGSTYADTISGVALGTIDAVRIVADARRPARSGGQRDVTFGWSVNVPLRNVP
jgi:hypothetical protein